MAEVGSAYINEQIDSYEAARNNVREVNSDLDRDAFMNLLITEMKNQDPLDPVSNKDMMAQLASFSSLEQMEKMNSSMDEFIELSQPNPWSEVAAFLGKDVVAKTDSGNLEGHVNSAYQKEGTMYLDVDGYEILPEEIIGIR